MTNQSDKQQSVRDATGTALNYEGDWHALFDDAGIPVGDFNGRMLDWINDYLGSSYTELNGAMNAFAIASGVANWNSLGFFDASGANLYFTDDAKTNAYFFDDAKTQAYNTQGGVLTPVNLVAPALSGPFVTGQTMTTSNGTWSDNPVAYEYRWTTDGILNGAVVNSYVNQLTDDGKKLIAQVRARNAAGTWSAWVNSNEVIVLRFLVWMDSTDAYTLFADTARTTPATTTVGGVTDKSGSGNHMTQGTAARQPTTNARTIGGLNALDYVDDGLNFPAGVYDGIEASNHTAYASWASDVTTSSDTRIIAGRASAASRWIMSLNSTNQIRGLASSGFNPVTATITRDTNPHISVFYRGESINQTIVYDGTAQATNTNGADNNLTSMAIGMEPGATAYHDGPIQEIFIAGRKHTLDEMNQVGRYLQRCGATWTDLILYTPSSSDNFIFVTTDNAIPVMRS